MDFEKRIWIASLLSAIILVFYTQSLGKSIQPPKGASSPSQQPVQLNRDVVKSISRQDEGIVSLESRHLIVRVGESSAAIHTIVLKDFKKSGNEGESIVFGEQRPVILIEANKAISSMKLVEHNSGHAIWRADGSQGTEVEFRLDNTLPVIYLRITSDSKSFSPRLTATWTRGDAVSGSGNVLEAFLLTKKTIAWQRQYLHYSEGASSARPVPRGTEQATLSERFFCLSLKPGNVSQVNILPATRGLISAEISPTDGDSHAANSYEIKLYAGPRDFFKLRDANFEQAFPLGLLAKIGLALMLFLKGIASIVRNYGLAIIILSISITALFSPFTILSYRSMKKMQELQPKLDQIKKKHENDPQKTNQMTMSLFREHRVSPLSGCLPMLLQMPIFFALWSAISHVIELRGQSFLWIRDLSMPDHAAKLPFGYLNVLPIFMAVAMYAQSKLTQKNLASAQSAQSKMFSGPMMAVLFGVMFYQLPSSLVLYWLTNNLVSIASMRMAKI